MRASPSDPSVHPGEHPALIAAALWDPVQALLQRQRPAHGSRLPNPLGAFLRGRLYCAACGCTMTHSHATKGSKRYRYYLCTAARKHGWQSCPAPSLPAGPIEQLVVEQIRKRCQDAALGNFEAVWQQLPHAEQVRLVQLLLERVDYDAAQGQVSITFAPAGIPRLAQELAEPAEQTSP
jgi:site-specific DNA recombinase